MKLTSDQVKKVAKLANLTLTEDEVVKLGSQLSDTLNFIGELNEINIENIEPTSSVTGLVNVMRDDEIEPSLSQDEALQNATNRENGYFKVKAIFDES